MTKPTSTFENQVMFTIMSCGELLPIVIFSDFPFSLPLLCLLESALNH